MTLKEVYQVQRMDSYLDSLVGVRIFSTLDANSLQLANQDWWSGWQQSDSYMAPKTVQISSEAVWSEWWAQDVPTYGGYYTAPCQVLCCAIIPGRCHHLLEAYNWVSRPPKKRIDIAVESWHIAKTKEMLLLEDHIDYLGHVFSLLYFAYRQKRQTRSTTYNTSPFWLTFQVISSFYFIFQ